MGGHRGTGLFGRNRARDVVIGYYAALDTADTELLRETVALDAVFHEADGTIVRGLGRTRGRIARCPDRTHRVSDVVVDGSRVVARWECSDAKGERGGLTVFHVSAGHIRAAWTFEESGSGTQRLPGLVGAEDDAGSCRLPIAAAHPDPPPRAVHPESVLLMPVVAVATAVIAPATPVPSALVIAFLAGIAVFASAGLALLVTAARSAEFGGELTELGCNVLTVAVICLVPIGTDLLTHGWAG